MRNYTFFFVYILISSSSFSQGNKTPYKDLLLVLTSHFQIPMDTKLQGDFELFPAMKECSDGGMVNDDALREQHKAIRAPIIIDFLRALLSGINNLRWVFWPKRQFLEVPINVEGDCSKCNKCKDENIDNFLRDLDRDKGWSPTFGFVTLRDRYGISDNDNLPPEIIKVLKERHKDNTTFLLVLNIFSDESEKTVYKGDTEST